jgi:hypothetical protein
VKVTMTSDPVEFWANAQNFLEQEPVLNTVVTSWVMRVVDGHIDWPAAAPYPRWFAVVHDNGKIVGAAMRSAPFEPYPAYVLPMTEQAGRALGLVLVDRGEGVAGLNGAMPGIQACAEVIAKVQGRQVQVTRRSRLHEVGTLIEPLTLVGARVRRAEPQDAAQLDQWVKEFHAEAIAQAEPNPGTPKSISVPEPDNVARIQREIEAGSWWVVETNQGELAHATAARAPAFGVARVGPVFTPREFRGRGYASAAVAEATRVRLAEGARVCLFTDLGNPVSNKIYRDLGYQPVTDMVDLVLA